MILLLLLSQLGYSNTEVLEQLFGYQDYSSSPFQSDRGDFYPRHFNVSPHFCQIYKLKREEIAHLVGTDRYSIEFDKIKSYSNLCSISVFIENDKYVSGFRFDQKGPGKSNREIRFTFKNRSLQDSLIHIQDDSALTGRMSHDFLETTIQFLPRVIIPHLEFNDPESKVQKIYLSTGESIDFDFSSNKIVGGVLEEGPIDLEPSRHARKFAPLKYTGRGIMIRADRRAGLPRNTFNVSYNQNEDIKKASIFYKDKICKILKTDIWENTLNGDKRTFLKYESDEKLLYEVINPKCGWNIKLKDIKKNVDLSY